MEVLATMVKNLLVVILIASFLEILIPDNSMRPFIRFAIGLFIILAILNPALQAVYKNRELQSLAWELPMEFWDQSAIQDQGLELNQDIAKAGDDMVTDKIEKQIKALAALVPGVQGLETRALLDFNRKEIASLELTIKTDACSDFEEESVQAFGSEGKRPKDEKEIQEKLFNLMENLYGLERQKVVIKFEGG